MKGLYSLNTQTEHIWSLLYSSPYSLIQWRYGAELEGESFDLPVNLYIPMGWGEIVHFL